MKDKLSIEERLGLELAEVKRLELTVMVDEAMVTDLRDSSGKAKLSMTDLMVEMFTKEIDIYIVEAYTSIINLHFKKCKQHELEKETLNPSLELYRRANKAMKLYRKHIRKGSKIRYDEVDRIFEDHRIYLVNQERVKEYLKENT